MKGFAFNIFLFSFIYSGFPFIFSNLPSFTRIFLHLLVFPFIYSNFPSFTVLSFIYCIFLEVGVHGDATQLQQQGLAELHLHGSVQTGETLGDVSYDDGGGVLCPHQPQSPPCTAQSSDLLNTASLLLGRKTGQKRTLQRYSPE